MRMVSHLGRWAGAAALGAVLAFTLGTQQAEAVFVDITSASPLVIDYSEPPPGSPDYVGYSPSPADKVLWTENSVPSQDPGTIQNSIISEFVETRPLFLVG